MSDSRKSLTNIAHKVSTIFKKCSRTLIMNDPSAGSPTETLLRLLLPLNDQVWITFQFLAAVASCQNPIRKPH
jgi:hypothetical protein